MSHTIRSTAAGPLPEHGGPVKTRTPLTFRYLTAPLALWLLTFAAAPTPSHAAEPLRFEGFTFNSVHGTLTDHWVSCTVVLTNQDTRGRIARVMAFYAGDDTSQYGRDVWVPGGATVSAWLLIGPAPPKTSGSPTVRDLHFTLIDRTAGTDHFVPPPPGKDQLRSGAMSYRPREPITTIMLETAAEPADAEPDAESDLENNEAVELVRAFRASAGLSEHVRTFQDTLLPPTADAFDGIAHFVVASARLGDDEAGLLAVRHWVERGGTCWVMLDRTGPDVVTRLLDDATVC